MNSTAISLGWDCGPVGHGVDTGLRTTKENGYRTCPFDLMITNYQGVIECIQDDFKYFCDPRFLHIMPIEKDYTYLAFKKGERVIVNTKYNFIFNHESPGHGNLYQQENWENGQEHFIVNNFKAFIERYTQRIENFHHYVHDPQCYVHFILSKPFIHTKNHIQGLEKMIEKKYGSHGWQMVRLEESRIPIYQEAQYLMRNTIPQFYQSLLPQLQLQQPQPPTPTPQPILESSPKVVFTIAHKYIRGHETNIDYYVSNIKKYYKDSKVFIVDNNSTDIKDIEDKLSHYLTQPEYDVQILHNQTEYQFELGAYHYGIQTLLETNEWKNYDYFVFTQDSYILKNKYDFHLLRNNRQYACPLMELDEEYNKSSFHVPFTMKILEDIHISPEVEKLTLCWANSFILHQSKIEEFYSMTKGIRITNKEESCHTERFLAGVLYKLNGHRNYNIDGFVTSDLEITDQLPYNPWTVNVKYYPTHKYFVKSIYNKTEETHPLEPPPPF